MNSYDRATIAIWIAIVLGLGALFYSPVWMEQWQCRQYQEVTGRATRYVAWTCYVQDESGTWWARDQLRATELSGSVTQ